MVIFHSYVKLPEGKQQYEQQKNVLRAPLFLDLTRLILLSSLIPGWKNPFFRGSKPDFPSSEWHQQTHNGHVSLDGLGSPSRWTDGPWKTRHKEKLRTSMGSCMAYCIEKKHVGYI